jgi:hypothetical protein
VCTKIHGIATRKAVFFTESTMTVRNNFLFTLTTAVTTRNNAIIGLKQDDKVEEVYTIATKVAP